MNRAKRFLERVESPAKSWKFSASDVQERVFWDDYMAAYEDMFNQTSTRWAPWHIVPADNKWFTRLAVGAIIAAALREIDPKYPKSDGDHRRALLEAKAILENEE